MHEIDFRDIFNFTSLGNKNIATFISREENKLHLDIK